MNLLYKYFANDPAILEHLELPEGASPSTRIFKSRQPVGDAKDRIALLLLPGGDSTYKQLPSIKAYVEGGFSCSYGQAEGDQQCV